MISYDYEKINEYDLELLKESANKSLTDLAKTSYSISNAKYGVYKSKEDAKNGLEPLAVFATDKFGKTSKIALTSGI